MDDITAGVHNKIKIIDDTLLYEESIEDCFFATCRYIELCARNGVVFNPAKFKFGRTEVDFAGFTVTDTGVKPTKKMLEAIREFPKPTNLTGARSWFGLVNQVAYSFAQRRWHHSEICSNGTGSSSGTATWTPYSRNPR